MKSKPESEHGIQTIRDLIERRADGQPDAAFLIGPETGHILTFRGLQEQACLISAQLRRAGLEFAHFDSKQKRPEGRLCLSPSEDYRMIWKSARQPWSTQIPLRS